MNGTSPSELEQWLRSLSNRAEISAARFTNEYSFGTSAGAPDLAERSEEILRAELGR
jgi:hypothetical protein